MSEEKVNYRQWLNKALKYWYLFLLIPAVVIGGAYYYLKTAKVEYVATALLLIKDEKKSGQPIEEAVFDELGLDSKNKNLGNEIFILRSSLLMAKVVQTLNLQYQYFKIGKFRLQDLYNRTPVRVLSWQPNTPDSSLVAELHFTNQGSYKLQFDKKKYKHLAKLDYQGEFGKALDLPMGRLTLTSATAHPLENGMVIKLMSQRTKAKDLISRLGVEQMGEETSTLMLSIRDEVPERASAILAQLIVEYNLQSIADRNHAYANSLDLLNERITMVNDELSNVEMDVAAYKKRFNTIELSAEGNMLMQEMSDYNKTIANNKLQLEILESIEDFLIKNRETFEFVPTNLMINNLTLTPQLEAFNEQLRLRSELRTTSGPSHPDVILAEKQIKNMRESIIANIRNIKHDLQLASAANKDQHAALEARMQRLPTQERELVDIERRKGVKENLYLYLLQKREESALSMAVTIPSGKVIEPPEAYGPVSPKKTQILLIALFFAVVLPIGLMLLLESFNDKIQPDEDLEQMTGVPVVGMLAQSRKNSNLVVKERSRSVDAEMFRLLRANLAYIAPEHDFQSLLITSGVSGEGKSFIALNLALTQAIAGKKVVILELDLRKPKQAQYIGNKKEDALGVVNYIIDPNTEASDIIQHTELHPNLDVISCGTKPPNPAELILSKRLRQLVKELRKNYDFIIIDAPPVGLVADALQMKDLAEATMFVVRSSFSHKAQLNILKDIAHKGKLPKPFIVLNAVNLNKLGAYSHANGYSYAYASSNGYYEAS